METHSTNDSGFGRMLAEIIATYRQVSAFSAHLFEPLARLYVGNLAARMGREDPVDVVNLALKKLLYEAGELLTASSEPRPGEPSEPRHDASSEIGRAATTEEIPDLKLAYVAAAVLVYMKRRDQRETAEAERAAALAASRVAPGVVAHAAPTVRTLRIAPRAALYGSAYAAPSMVAARYPAYDVRATKGCGCGGPSGGGGCGCGGGTRPPPPRPPCYDPCAGGIVPPAPPREQCGCAACRTKSLVPVAPEKCPPCLSISCETRMKLRDCLKIAICELLKTYAARLPACQPSSISTNTSPGVAALQSALCAFLKCAPEALCPTTPPVDCGPKVPMPCLPCDYAVEAPGLTATPPLPPPTDVIL